MKIVVERRSQELSYGCPQHRFIRAHNARPSRVKTQHMRALDVPDHMSQCLILYESLQVFGQVDYGKYKAARFCMK
jgi:hypothetical protein